MLYTVMFVILYRQFIFFAVFCINVLPLYSAPVSNKTNAGQNLDDSIQEKIEVWVKLDISCHIKETTIINKTPKASNPVAVENTDGEVSVPVDNTETEVSETAESTIKINFTREGVYTFARIKPQFGGGYRAYPGRLPGMELPLVTNVSITVSHTCFDKEGRHLGQAQRVLVGLAGGLVYMPEFASSGNISIFALPEGKIQIHLMPSIINIPNVGKCNTGYKFNTQTRQMDEGCTSVFPTGMFTIGKKSYASSQADGGEIKDPGYDLGVYYWDDLKTLLKEKNSEGALALSAGDSVIEENKEITYTVKGWIGHIPDSGKQ